MAASHQLRTVSAVLALALSVNGCDGRAGVDVTGRAGKDVHDPSAQIVQDQFLIEYTLKNTSSGDLVFDRMEELWSPVGERRGLRQTVLPRGGPWRLSQGEAKTFVSGTNGYTLQLTAAAKGRPVEFSVTLYNGEKAVLSPFVARLPELQTLPRVDQHILSLRNSDKELPEELGHLPTQDMKRISFSKR